MLALYHAASYTPKPLVDRTSMEWNEITSPACSPAQRRSVYRMIGNRAHLHEIMQQATAEHADRLIRLLLEIMQTQPQKPER